MRPYAKNSPSGSFSGLSKLALMMLSLSSCALYATPDYSCLVSAIAPVTYTSTITEDTLAATGIAKVGTADDLNENYIGWSTTPQARVNFSLTGAELIFGGSLAADEDTSSSYNALTIADYIRFQAGSLNMGMGALGTGDSATLVDTTKSANGNVLTISGAGYQTTAPAGNVSTMLYLSTSGVTSYIGYYGNNNTAKVTKGGSFTGFGTLKIGASDANNPAYGCHNSLTVSGKVDIAMVGGDITIPSTFDMKALTVGDYGSYNTVTFSDYAYATLNDGLLIIGNHGSYNGLSLSGNSVLETGIISVGYKPSASGNYLSVNDSTVQVDISRAMDLNVGTYGSNNTFSANNSVIEISCFFIGKGDDDQTKDNLKDGTEGFLPTEGCNNTATITNSNFRAASIYLGDYGSDNALTVKDSGIYLAWVDSIPSGATKGDGKVQFDEITDGIDNLTVGYGRASTSTEDYSAFAQHNALTFDNCVMKLFGSFVIGNCGTHNSVVLKNATKMAINTHILIGDGNLLDARQGSSNTCVIDGKNTSISIAGGLALGQYGSNNAFTVSGGASALFAISPFYFGTGAASTSTTDNTALGCGNILTVTGKGSTLQMGNTFLLDLKIGDYGSNNELVVSDGATCIIKANDVTLGCAGTELGNVLNSHKVYSRGNKITVSGGATLDASNTNTIVVGVWGIENSLTVTGEGSYFVADDIYIGVGNANSVAFGSYNSVEVSDGAVLVGDAISIGQSPTSGYSGAHNSLTVDGGVIVSTKYIRPNVFNSEDNVLRIKNGVVALIGKTYQGASWADYIVNGYDVSYDDPSTSWLDGVSLVDKGGIQIWDATIGAYRKAIKSDLSIKYYSSEADAKAATGYEGLAGYTILTQTNDLSRLAWAGDVYDGGNGAYCSSWYGWFYNDAAYGDYIMSYNNYSWQYVDPSSTPENTNLYDYSLGAWLYTNSTYFENKWVYNYSTSAWMQLGQ